MTIKKSRRALVVTGAGASLDFGIPGTAELTGTIEAQVLADKFSRCCGADSAYKEIRDKLAGYFQGGASAVNFEHVYHCAHELLFTFEPPPTTLDEYRPILVPFIEGTLTADERALRTLVERMAKFLFDDVSTACDRSTASLAPLTDFVDKLREDHITRVYTTNYDDVLLRAVPDFYTGFDTASRPGPSRFDPHGFWDAMDADGLFHIHGSVHMAAPHPMLSGAGPGELCWFEDRAEARLRAFSTGSGLRRMDGTRVASTALITGLDKLSRLQRSPFLHYYASLTRDATVADVIFLIGSGLFDLHLNTWLSVARRRVPTPPLVFIDCWPDGFLDSTSFDIDPKTTVMFHALGMRVDIDIGALDSGDGWTLDKDHTCAVWDRGLRALLLAPGEVDRILAKLA